MGRSKRIKDMSDDLSNAPVEWLQAQLSHWQLMATTSVLIRKRRWLKEDLRRVKQLERALKEKLARASLPT